jgi:bifunctional ADP-heptose synthase (sugar kinase/adenylyltransferase)
VVGDFCLDAYWQLAEGGAELSLETGKPTRAVLSQRYTPGGAGNVASNLAALGAGSVCAFSIIGPDMFGRELAALLGKRGIDSTGLVVQDREWETPVYAKPYLKDTEQERIDFGRWNVMKSEPELEHMLRGALPRLDAIVVNQQLERGIQSPAMIRTLNEIARSNPRITFVLDARTMSDSFTGMICKLNGAEAARQAARSREVSPADPREAIRMNARIIGNRCGKPVVITRGAEGILVFDGTLYTDIPAVPLTGPIDTVGAGDATVAAIAASLAAGGTLVESGEIGNLAGGVTATKVRETGTATRGEILAMARRRGVS